MSDKKNYININLANQLSIPKPDIGERENIFGEKKV